MKKLELLAPAGDMLSFEAALKNGADAVYVGAGAFGARASAGFDDDTLRGLIRTAHLHGKRVYVTVNTLVKDDETDEAMALLRQLDAFQADAVLIQDIGMMRFIKDRLPGLPVHASTQMSIHNAAGARFLLGQGLTRVVLARECSLAAIEAVSATGIETEVFVHGALCVSVSGQCLMSSQIGGRSGNRGRCAQPCRLDYSYRNKKGAWLSPRDLSQIENIPQLAAAGVSSFKIEGRLKRPEYVAIVCQAYRKAIDKAVLGKKHDDLADDKRELMQIFNRGGFTQGHAFLQSDAQLINPLHVSHEGLPIGTLLRSQSKDGYYQGEALLTDALHHGDMLQILSAVPQDMIYSGPPVMAGGTVSLRHHMEAKPGDKVMRLVDEQQLKRARETMQGKYPPIPIKAQLSLLLGQPARLSLSDGSAQAAVTGEVPQPSRSMPMTLETTRTAVEKTGDSPFVVSQYAFEGQGDSFMPVSALNALRRQGLDSMAEARLASYQRGAAGSGRTLPERIQVTPLAEGLYARTGNIAMAEQLRQAGAGHILYAPQDYTDPQLAGQLLSLREGDYFCLPRQVDDTLLTALHEMAQDARAAVLLDNVGQMALPWSFGALAGPGIPVWNKEALDFLEEHQLRGFVCSRELSREEAMALDGLNVPMLLPVYGRAEIMMLNHCPERTFRGLSGSQKDCRLCAAGEGTLGRALKDRLGADFPLFPARLSDSCLNRLLFHTPLHLSKKAFGRRWLMEFTIESAEETLQITRYYAALLRGGTALPDLSIPYYAGRFDSGVQ